MNDDNQSSDDRATSDSAPFNMAIESLRTLQDDIRKAHLARRLQDLRDWLHILDGQYSLLVGMVNIRPEDEKEIRQYKLQSWRVVGEHNNRENCNIPYNSQDRHNLLRNCKHFGQLFFNVEKYDYTLSKVMGYHKLLMAGKDDPKYAFGGKGA